MTNKRAGVQETKDTFRELFRAAATGIACSNPLGRFIQANEAYCKMLGYTEAELLTRDFASITHPDDLATNLILRDEILAGSRESFVMEKRYLKKSGEILWVRHSVSAARASDGKILTMIVIAEDINERKKAEHELRESERRFSNAFGYAPIGVALVGLEGQWLKVNQALCNIVGYSESELLGRNVLDITHPEDIEMSRESIRLVRAGEVPSYQNEKRYIHKNGHSIYILLNVSLVRGAQNEPLYFITQVQDFTERKRVEARFRRLVDSNIQPVMFWNKKGEILGGNDAFLELVGYSREDLDLARISWAAMTPLEHSHLDERALEQIAETGICSPYEKEWLRKDGTRVPIQIVSAVFEDNREEGICLVIDLTERKKFEAQFLQIQKMQSIGTLAAGVAHDFNNYLTVIQMQAHLFKTEASLTPAQSKHVEAITSATRHAADLTRQLLLFSRKQAKQLKDLDLSKTIDEMANLIRRTIGENIELKLKISGGPFFVRADASMIHQVLINLVANSRDAMPRGGCLVIEMSAFDFDETITAQSAKARAGSFVALSVSDNGCGISRENLSRIFEPFFTTKEVGKGTGLGLATLFGIVQQHDGWVNVYSELGLGTTFHVYLPRLNSTTATTEDSQNLSCVLGGNETILLVEDEKLLRDSVHQILSKLGYQVFVASHAAEALEVWQSHRDEIKLVLTDLVMPGAMTGKDLGEQLLRENPKLKVIYSSGYSAEIASGDLHLEEGNNFLTKPYVPAKLIQTVRECLDKE